MAQALPELRRRQAVFASGFAKWLIATLPAVDEPRSAAYLLGAALAACGVAPSSTKECYLVARLHAEQRIVELKEGQPLPERERAHAAGSTSEPTSQLTMTAAEDQQAHGENMAILRQALAACV